jgi:Protein of unknown function (DUF3987)
MSIDKFLSAFFPDENELIYFRAFKPKNTPDNELNHARIISYTRGQLKDLETVLRLHKINNHCGVYFTPNAGGSCDKDIIRFNAVFVENDSLPLEQQHQLLDSCPIPPSIRVETKRSIHGYWLLKEGCTTEEWCSFQKLLIDYFDGDKAIKNPSRVMRLPFMAHLYYNEETREIEKQKVTIHTFEDERRYSIAELRDAFGVTEKVTRKDNILLNGNHLLKESYTFEFHEDRHSELIRLITQKAKPNSQGNFDMKCPAHKGKGETSLVYFPSSDAVICNAKCSYFDILGAFGLPTNQLPSREKKGSEQAEHFVFKLHKKALHGLAGDFVNLVLPQSEADEAALLIQFLCAFSNVIGRNAYLTLESDPHYLNIFVLIIGNTGAGRKGTSWGHIKRLFKLTNENWATNCVVSGLSTGEGLMHRVRDPIIKKQKNPDNPSEYEELVVDPGVEDKRLLVVEGEFAQVLRTQGRETNTLSAMLRNFWDTGTHSSLVKNAPLKTTDAHINIIGHITGEEFISSLNSNEMVNGYLNRFLMFWSERSKFIPFGSRLKDEDFAPIKGRLATIEKFAKNVEEMDFTPNAKEFWKKVYAQLETGRSGILAKVTQRASPYVLRVACIYALLDKSDVVDIVHLQAALAVWQYAENTARRIFGGKSQTKNAQKLIIALRQSVNGMTRTQIRDLF